MQNNTYLILSCEHAVDTIPNEYLYLFNKHQEILKTHRAIDFGADSIANFLSSMLHCDLISAAATRLLIDCNRSLTSACFSEITHKLSMADKQQIIATYYLPFRTQVAQKINTAIASGKYVLHLSIHSFTPIFHGIVRNADLGLLYDPSRATEKNFARNLQKQLKSHYHTRLNYPYLGISDGHTTALRKQYADHMYTGIEVECNQKLTRSVAELRVLEKTLADSLAGIL